MSRNAFPADDGRPDINDFEGENEWTQLARKYWNSSITPRKVNNEVIRNEIWDVLENQSFPFRSLLILENLQLLERSVKPIWMCLGNR